MKTQNFKFDWNFGKFQINTNYNSEPWNPLHDDLYFYLICLYDLGNSRNEQTNTLSEYTHFYINFLCLIFLHSYILMMIEYFTYIIWNND